MREELLDEELARWADHMKRLEWSSLILDGDLRLVWVSDELQQFVGTSSEDDLGYGLHVVEAVTKDVWLRTAHPDSYVQFFSDLAPSFIEDYRSRGGEPENILPEQLAPLLEMMPPPSSDLPLVWSTSFLYVSPNEDDGLPPYRVNVCFLRLNDDQGSTAGWLLVFFMAVRPNLLSLLSRGDEQMYERMANLVDPGPRQAAVLFCDLHRSVDLSRRLPSGRYFRLVRRLWTGIDDAIAGQTGIVGKHAGDGASAYFLVDDLGSPPAAAAAALRAARRIQEISDEVFAEILEDPCVMKIGVHWGGTLYMGQLVPGGRLDVTALGDEVNQAARVQESAGPGETLVSKELFERLTDEDAAALGLDIEKVRFATVAELETASEKAKLDAGSIAVAPFN